MPDQPSTPTSPAVETSTPTKPGKDSDRPGYEYDPFFGLATDQRRKMVASFARKIGYESTRPLPNCPPLWFRDCSDIWDRNCTIGWIFYEIPRFGGGILVTLIIGAITAFARSRDWM